MDVLNPVLYRRLKRCFGSVKISGRGEAMICHAAMGLDDSEDGEKRLLIEHARLQGL